MKQILAVMFFCSGIAVVNAQEVAVGLQGGFGTTWLINSNVSDQAENLDYLTSYGSVFGINAGYLFGTTTNTKIGIMLEANLATVNQDYTGKLDSFTFTARDQVRYIQVPVLFHITGRVLFFEIGPQFSFVSNATGSFDASPPLPILEYTNRDIKASFNSSTIGVAFGLGGHFNIATNLFIDAKLRFSYGLTDATMDYGSAGEREIEYYVSQRSGVASYYANRAQTGGLYQYKPTNAATGHFILGLSYRFPTGARTAAAPATP